MKIVFVKLKNNHADIFMKNVGGGVQGTCGEFHGKGQLS